MDEFRLDFPRVYKVERDGEEVGCAHGSQLMSGSYINLDAAGDYIRKFDVLTDSQTRESYSVSAIFQGEHGGQRFISASILRVTAPPTGQTVQSINIGTLSGNNASFGNSGLEIKGNTFSGASKTDLDDLKKMAGSVPPEDLPEFFDLVRDLEQVESGEKDAKGALKPYQKLLDKLTDIGAFVAKLSLKFMVM